MIAIPAAALVLRHHESPAIRLVPITAIDFYAMPDLHPLGRETDAAGNTPAGAEHVRARAAVGVPAAGADLLEVQGGAGGRGREARGLAREEAR